MLSTARLFTAQQPSLAMSVQFAALDFRTGKNSNISLIFLISKTAILNEYCIELKVFKNQLNFLLCRQILD